MARWLKRLGIGLLSFAALLLVGLVVLANFDWNRARPFIARKSKEMVGRELLIKGDLQVQLLTATPGLVAHGVTFENAEWAGKNPLFSTERIAVAVRLWPLFRRQIEMPLFELDRPRLELERRKDGTGNWALELKKDKKDDDRKDKKDDEKMKLPVLHRVRIDDARMRWQDQVNTKTVFAKLDHFSIDEDSKDSPIRVHGAGAVDDLPLSIEATLGSVAAVEDGGNRYPFELTASLAQAKLTADGRVHSLKDFSGLDSKFTLQIKDLTRLADKFNVTLGEGIPPFAAKGQLSTKENSFQFTKDDMTLGKSHLSGEATVDTSGPRPSVKGDVAVSLLRMMDLAGLTPPKVDREMPAERQDRAAKSDEQVLVFSDKPIDLSGLNKVDLDVKLALESFEGSKSAQLFERLAGRVRLDAGRLQINPFQLRAADGSIVASAVVDARQTPPAIKLDADVRRLSLDEIMSTYLADKQAGRIEADQTLKGRLAATINLQTTGGSLHNFMQQLDGQVNVAIQDGRINNVFIEALGLDPTQAIGSYFSKNQKTDLECFLARLDVKDGLVKPNPLLMATGDSNVDVSGHTDLGKETFELDVRTHPKDFSLGTLRSPLQVRGTYGKPKMDVEKAPLAARILTAVGLGAVIGPAAALIPFVELGLGKEGRCSDYAQALERVQLKAAH